MKKLFDIFLVVLICALCACNKNNETTDTQGTTETEKTTTTVTSVTTASIIPEEIITLETTTETTPAETHLIMNPIVETAEGLIGIDFAENGASPSEGFDNSGFIYYVLRENGYINCPRKISEQINWGENAGFDEIKAGDVLYFSESVGKEASFGGIYSGNGEMIYSPFPGEKVKRADITTDYWKDRFVTALSL